MTHSGRRFEPQASNAEFFEDPYADYLALRAESAR
jgi:hypothetical protein